jgi:RTX calcium-binding nonapeptide repeat (4 copies)/WD40-like Beta Propeller Repeat
LRWIALLPALLLVTIGGSVARAGCSPTLEWQDAGPRWSPDGSRLAFYRVLPGCDPAPVAIEVIDAAGGPARRVGMAYGQRPASWSPDGKLLAFGGPRGIVLASVEDGRSTEVTSGADTGPAWSPDGAWIAFRRGSPAGAELWIVRPDGSSARRLAGGLHDHALPVWSPDSRELAFAGSTGGSVDVQVVDVAGGSVRAVAPSPAFDAQPSWSRDGSTIAFVSERDREPTVYVVARDGSNVRRWIEGHDPAFDPQVDALAYVRKDGVWVETGAIAPAKVVSRPDVLGRVDWRPVVAPLPDFAFSAGGRCGRYGIYVFSAGSERRLTNPCEFRGNGVVRGTPFRDFLYGGRGPDRLLGGGRADVLDGGAGNDVLDGDGGRDTLLGRGGEDVLIGRGDPDTIVGGPGRDRISAGGERDTISAKDGWRDTISCGAGRDAVDADRFDDVAPDCERVRR